MKVVVDELRCDAHGVCVSVCPEVFDLNDDDDVVRLIDEYPDPSLRESIEKAVQQCPKAAIAIEE
jgi:ferredoxin